MSSTRPTILCRGQGQLMIITVLVLGGAIMGASTIAGFLMTRSIRQSTLAEDSAKAIFAADAGLENLMFECVKKSNCNCSSPPGPCKNKQVKNICNAADHLENDACYIISFSRDSAGLFEELRSVGFSDFQTKRTARALIVTF